MKQKTPDWFEHLWRDFTEDVTQNRVFLPSMPDIALKVRQSLQDVNISSNRIAQLIGSDPVLCSNLIRATNSPIYRGSRQVDDIKGAVTRLGLSGVRAIVTSYAVEQVYASNQGQNPLRKKLIKQIWSHSTHVAALSHVIAANHTHLQADKAMFSGLLHDIGKLPLIEYAERIPDLQESPALLEKMLSVLHGRVGKMILTRWEFAKDVIRVTAEHEDYLRAGNGRADYVDVVIVANLLSHIGSSHHCAELDWSTVPAFTNIQLAPEASIAAMKSATEEINEIKRLFT